MTQTLTTGCYGRFATSTFLILIAVIVSSLLFAGGKLDAQVMANILFAVIGFAGGLFTVKASGTQTDTSKRGASKKASEDLNAKS